MRFRDAFRRLRLYYHSWPLFRERLARPGIACWLPWLRAERTVELRFRSGRVLSMRAGQWPLLASACRLERIGAEFELLEDAKRVRIDGLTLYSPLWDRDEPANYKEVLLDDGYEVKSRDLTGWTVVDVGAYMGDSTAAFVRRGARVHALEPSQVFCSFIRRNLAENGMSDRVTLHQVGLAEREHVIERGYDRLCFVEGVSYAIEKLPRGVEMLKLDCEGAEYYLLSDARFLEHLAPREIRMEYHRGPKGAIEPLRRAGYEVTVQRSNGSLGLVVARQGDRRAHDRLDAAQRRSE